MLEQRCSIEEVELKGIAVQAIAGLAALGLLLGFTPSARADIDPTKPYVLFDFEADEAGFVSGVETSVISHNTDPQYASQGSNGSLKIDLTGHDYWSDQIAYSTLPEPVDLSKFAFVQADVFVPAGSRGLDDQGNPTWSQLGLITQEPYTSPGNRDFYKEGWNRLVWPVNPDQTAEVTTVRFFVNQGVAWEGPIYVDNITLLPGQAKGLVPQDQILIAGFNTEAEVSLLAEDYPRELNTDSEFITEGSGSLFVDLTDMEGWLGNILRAVDLPAIDLSQMEEIRLDVYVPQESAADWYQIGAILAHSNGETFLSSHGLMPGWNTLVWDLTTRSEEERANLASVTGFGLISNSSPWRGPIYVDALRGSKSLAGAVVTPPVKKGDVNGNGQVDITDVVAVLRHVAGLSPLTGDALTAADVDATPGVSITDVVAILRAVAGLSTLP